MVECSLDVKQHIKELEQKIAEYEARKDQWTPEDEEAYHELKRRLYRSKVRNNCC